jgi:predicted Zn-dependent protease
MPSFVIRRSFRAAATAALMVMLFGLTAGCRNAPVSGRSQVIAVPEQQEKQLGDQAWQEVLGKEQVTQNVHYADLVERVGRRIAAVADRPDYDWEFKVFASDKANAFALPGGKVAIYEGILPICENEAGLAVVMSHEVSHVLARHGGERMTQQGAAQLGGGLLGKALQRRSAGAQEKWMNAYGIASQYGVLLPYSRTHESEADSIGLTLMAKAGYDPSEAPRFWQRFAKVSGPKPPEFLSTHPSDSHRAEHLHGLLPQALALYKAAPEKLGTGMAIARPPAQLSADRGIQLADHETAPASSTGSSPASAHGIAPAALAEVAVDEFLPPIQRALATVEVPDIAAAADPGPSSDPFASSLPSTAPADGQPAPFPSGPAQPIPPGGWTPASP